MGWEYVGWVGGRCRDGGCEGGDEWAWGLGEGGGSELRDGFHIVAMNSKIRCTCM